MLLSSVTPSLESLFPIFFLDFVKSRKLKRAGLKISSIFLHQHNGGNTKTHKNVLAFQMKIQKKKLFLQTDTVHCMVTAIKIFVCNIVCTYLRKETEIRSI